MDDVAAAGELAVVAGGQMRLVDPARPVLVSLADGRRVSGWLRAWSSHALSGVGVGPWRGLVEYLAVPVEPLLFAPHRTGETVRVPLHYMHWLPAEQIQAADPVEAEVDAADLAAGREG